LFVAIASVFDRIDIFAVRAICGINRTFLLLTFLDWASAFSLSVDELIAWRARGRRNLFAWLSYTKFVERTTAIANFPFQFFTRRARRGRRKWFANLLQTFINDLSTVALSLVQYFASAAVWLNWSWEDYVHAYRSRTTARIVGKFAFLTFIANGWFVVRTWFGIANLGFATAVIEDFFMLFAFGTGWRGRSWTVVSLAERLRLTSTLVKFWIFDELA